MDRRCRIALALAACVMVNGLATAAYGALEDEAPEAVFGFETRCLVNDVHGAAVLERADAEPRPLVARDRLVRDDVVRVDGGARAEVLLNPGYFAWLGERTDLRCLDLSPSNLKLSLDRGSMVVEIAVLDPFSAFYFVSDDVVEGIYEFVTVVTPSGNVVLQRGGLYRLDVASDGTTSVGVVEGAAELFGETIEGGQRATSRGAKVTTERFDAKRSSADELDRWSRERSKRAVDANRSLQSFPWFQNQRADSRKFYALEAGKSPCGDEKAHSTVSATADTFTFVETGDEVRRANADWTSVEQGAHFQVGDRIRTGPSSRAAADLFPNCRLFVSWSSEVALVRRDGGRATVEVVRGSAEVVSSFSGQLVTLVAKGRSVDLLRDGCYRVDVSPDGRAELRVRRGRARVGATEIGGNGRLRFGDTDAKPASLQNERDAFDEWCRQSSGGVDARASTLSRLKCYRPYYGGVWFDLGGERGYTFLPARWKFRSALGPKYDVRVRTYRGESWQHFY